MPQRKYTSPEEIESMRRAIALASKGRSRKTKSAAPILKTAGSALFGVVVLLLLGVLFSIHLVKSKGELPGLCGYHLFVIQSGSMEPTLPSGTVILSRRPRDAAQIEAGEIVSFKTSSGNLVTHRIVEVLTGTGGTVSYRTKGDNPLNSPDEELLLPERVIAVLVTAFPFT